MASADEIIYAGAFDFTQDALAPSMGFKPESLIPAESPAIRERVQPAKWLNGARSACLLSIYALEFPDVPYVKGYRGGGNVPSVGQTPKP